MASYGTERVTGGVTNEGKQYMQGYVETSLGSGAVSDSGPLKIHQLINFIISIPGPLTAWVLVLRYELPPSLPGPGYTYPLNLNSTCGPGQCSVWSIPSG